MNLIDFDSCPYSDRNGGYGGAAGDKDGILFHGERWMVKYPKDLFGMRKSDKLEKSSLTPLSEFLGSHIYGILGYPVHETLLGKRNGKIVVACKDFCQEGERFFEIRTIKNVHLKEVAAKAGLSPLVTGEDRMINLKALFVHMDVNPELRDILGLKERFWNQVVVDEGQDLSTNCFRLIRTIAGPKHENDIFIASDSHQRIYKNRTSLSKCGIDVRGRSSKLRINYRTTDEIRKAAWLS